MKERILLALSDTNLLKILSNKLTSIGHTVDSVSDGMEVQDRLKSFKPDLLLIDIVLPNKSGYDVLYEKSFDKDITKIPIIIISNQGEPIHIKEIPSTPTIKDYIIKTHVDPEEVIEKIEKAFGRENLNNIEINKKPIANSGKKVLWVEDDNLLSSILSRKIESSGLTLLKAMKDVEAFKILETEIPDIIMLDVMLPGMNGFDILQKIKTNVKFRKIPVIMLSNVDKQTDLEKSKLLGVNKYIVKATVSPNEIINEINNLLKLS